VVEMTIDTGGHVVATRVIQSVPALDQAAREYVSRWQFTPAVKNGRPVLQVDLPQEAELRPEDAAPESEQFGSLNGSDFGMAEGMEEGVEGGVVGGVPGGVLGGVIGGTGDGPVLDYDQAPTLIHRPPLVYPQDAFVKKIEGTVVVEMTIDTGGHVVATRVIQSVPALDQAAREYVSRWQFTPAVKNGRPVPRSPRP